MRGAVAICLLLAACNEPPTVQLQLVTGPRLDVTTNVTDLRLGFFRAGQATPEVDLGPMPRMLDGQTDLASTAGLVVGETYELRVVGTSERCSREDRRVVGRSLPFEHQEGSYTVSAQVGCAEELQLTRGQPLARIGHATVAVEDGGAIVAGGAGAVGFDPMNGLPSGRPVENRIERYDPATGRFEVMGETQQGRLFPGALRLSTGEVALAGGYAAGLSCDGSTEVVWPSRRSGSRLATQRCAPELVDRGDHLLVVGGSFPVPGTTPPALERLPADLVGDGEPVEDEATHIPVPQVASWEDDTLILGGSPFPTVERVRHDCAPDPPCVETLVPDAELPLAWSNYSMVQLSCPSGGGTAYVSGGTSLVPDEPATPCMTSEDCGAASDPTRACNGGQCTTQLVHREVYCFSTETGRFGLVGALDTPVYGHVTARVGPGGERQRLLLIGGLRAGEAVPRALPVTAGACTCAPFEPGAGPIDMPAGALVFLHTATTLADGTVLVVGGADTDSTVGETITGESYSALFVPDFE